MAKLSANGSELLRVSKKRDTTNLKYSDGGDSLTTWERVTRVYCSSGKILEKRDVRFKPSQFQPHGELYSYGWKVAAKMKPGFSIVDHVAKVRQLIAEGKSRWAIEGKGPKPVIISQARIVRAIESGESAGFCKACGARTDGVEPDARNYRCDSCGQMEVYGAEEMLIAG